MDNKSAEHDAESSGSTAPSTVSDGGRGDGGGGNTQNDGALWRKELGMVPIGVATPGALPSHPASGSSPDPTAPPHALVSRQPRPLPIDRQLQIWKQDQERSRTLLRAEMEKNDGKDVRNTRRDVRNA